MGTIWGAIDKFLAWLKNKLSDAAFQRISAKLDKLNTVGYLVAFGGLLVGGLMSGIALDRLGPQLGTAIATIIVLFPVGYFAYRFEDACRTVGEADITPLSVGVYLDIMVVLYLVLGSLGMIFGLVSLFIGFGAMGGIVLFVSTSLIFTSWLAACPERIGVRVDASYGAARDILSLPMIGIRILVRSAVPLSRAGMFIGGIACLFSGIMGFTAEEGSQELIGGFAYAFSETNQAAQAFVGNVGVLVAAAMFPFSAYFIYTLYSFLIGFAENFLSIKAIARNTAPEGSEQPAPAPAPAPAPVSEPGAAESAAPFGAAAATPFGAAPAAAPAPAPVAAPAPAEPAGLAPGAACKVQWSDGTFPTGTVKQMANGQVLVTFSDGRAETWVPEQYVTPT